MRISVRQARRELSEAKIKEWGECEIVSDGEVIAILSPVSDVAQAVVSKPSVALRELPLSKARQAAGRLPKDRV